MGLMVGGVIFKRENDIYISRWTKMKNEAYTIKMDGVNLYLVKQIGGWSTSSSRKRI